MKSLQVKHLVNAWQTLHSNFNIIVIVFSFNACSSFMRWLLLLFPFRNEGVIRIRKASWRESLAPSSLSVRQEEAKLGLGAIPGFEVSAPNFYPLGVPCVWPPGQTRRLLFMQVLGSPPAPAPTQQSSLNTDFLRLSPGQSTPADGGETQR